MRYSDLHIHSVFSDGSDPIEALIRAAFERNLLSVGISDHSYTPFDTSYCMPASYIGTYLETIRSLKEKWADRIEVYAGLELDGFSEVKDRQNYDYLIGDCHYLQREGCYFPIDETKEEQQRIIDELFNGDALSFAEAYFETYTRCQEKNRPDILGHFDLPVLFGLIPQAHPRYRAAAVEALKECLKLTPILEVNTAAIAKQRKEPYPSCFLLREARRLGAKVLLSSDAHKKERLLQYFNETVELLRGIGYREILVYQNHAFREEGI